MASRDLEFCPTCGSVLGGEAGDSHAPAPVLDRAAEEDAGLRSNPPALDPDSRSAQAAEPPSDPLADCRCGNFSWDTVAGMLVQTKRAEQQRAAGIIREALNGRTLAAIAYIAEAAQKGEG